LAEIGTNASRISSLEDTIATLEFRTLALSSTITSLDARSAQTSSRINGVSDTISTLSSDTASLSLQVVEANTTALMASSLVISMSDTVVRLSQNVTIAGQRSLEFSQLLTKLDRKFGEVTVITVLSPNADFATIQEAIDFVVTRVWTTPVTIQIPAGSWTVSATLKVPSFSYASLVTLSGVSPTLTELTSSVGLLSCYAKEFTLSSMTITGLVNYASSGPIAVWVSVFSSIRLDNLHFKHWHTCVTGGEASTIIAHTITFTDFYYGVRVSSSVSFGQLTGATFEGPCHYSVSVSYKGTIYGRNYWIGFANCPACSFGNPTNGRVVVTGHQDQAGVQGISVTQWIPESGNVCQ
jgi:hypothetical protein